MNVVCALYIVRYGFIQELYIVRYGFIQELYVALSDHRNMREQYICSSYKHAPPIDEKAPRPSISEGRL